MTFNEWLLSQNIDVQTLEPDLADCLRLRFEQETAPEPEPATTVLVQPSDCQWPARVYRIPVNQ